MNNSLEYRLALYYLKAFMLVSIFILGIFVLVSVCFGADVDMGIIAQIESSGNPLAYNKVSQARGLYQVTPICLKEYNQLKKEVIKESELFNPLICYKVGNWYMNIRIPQLLRHYGIQDTLDNRLWAYNAGIGMLLKGIEPKETKDYIRKYHKKRSTK